MKELLSAIEKLAERAREARPSPLLLDRWAERLLKVDPERRLVLIRGSEPFRHSELVPHLIEVGHSRLYHQPRQALDAYRAASQVARFLPTDSYHADLHAEALANLGNAVRVIGDLSRAERLLERAEKQTVRGSGDAKLAARLAILTATLDVDLGDLEGAEIGFREAIDLYTELGEEHLAARTMLKLGRCYAMADDHTQALRYLVAGFQAADVQREPALNITAVMGVASVLGRIRRVREGLELLETLSSSGWLEQVGGRAAQVRVCWLMAELLLRGGNGPMAEEHYRQARSAFADLGLPLDAALAGLDLAEMYANMGEDSLVAAEAVRALEVLQAAGAEHHSLIALRLLYEAACRKATSGAVVQYATRRLRGAVAFPPGS